MNISLNAPRRFLLSKPLLIATYGMTVACSKSETRPPPPKQSSSQSAANVREDPTTKMQVPEARVGKLGDDSKIEIDGKLDESAWQHAANLQLSDPRTGKDHPRLPVSGSLRVLWGPIGFFVGFDVKDSNVIGGFAPTERDPHLWTRDTVEIMVDPDGDGDNRDYYEIQIGPQNLVFDSQFDDYNIPVERPDGPFGHENWSSGVTSAVSVNGSLDAPDDTDVGYVVEALLPWKAFSKAKRAPPTPGDTWRLNFYVIQANDGVSWSPILGQGNFHKASRFGRVHWTETIRSLPASSARAGRANATTE